MLQLILWYWTFEMHLELLSSRALQTFALLILYSLPKCIVKSSSDSDRSWNMVTSSFLQKVFSVDHCCHLLSTASNYNSSAVTANNVRLDQCANCATASPYLQIFQVSRAELRFSNGHYVAATPLYPSDHSGGQMGRCPPVDVCSILNGLICD